MAKSTMVHSFSVKQSASAATSHEVKVTIPTYEGATEEQRRNAWEYAIRQATVKVQGRLRNELGKGVRGEALDKAAQSAFDDALNGVRAKGGARPMTIDATEMGLTREQIDLFLAKGATVVNIPAKLAK